MAVPDGAGAGEEDGEPNLNGSAMGAMGQQQTQQSVLRRRLVLPSLHLSNTPSSDETIESGYHLFNGFLHEELARENLMQEVNTYGLPPIEIPSSHSTIPFASPLMNNTQPRSYSRGDVGTASAQSTSRRAGYASNQPMSTQMDGIHFQQYGRNIRELADEFTKSKQGQQIRDMADEVDLNKLDCNQFMNLLTGVFSDGKFSRDRIIAVFVFCSSLLIKAIRKKAIDIVTNIVKWCFNFLKDKVCSQVQQEGGWDAVLGSMVSVAKVGITAGLTILFSLAVLYIWKR